MSVCFGVIASHITSAQAQWTTVDNFQLVSGFSSVGLGLGTNEVGDIIAVGWAGTASGTNLGVIRQSTDLGTSWQAPSTFTYPGATGCSFHAVANDGKTLYVGGMANGVGWLIVQSTDGGNTWQVSDLFQAGGCSALAVDSFGNVFATGALNVSGTPYLVVRELRAGSSAWNTVYQSSSPGSTGAGIALRPTAEVFVIGSMPNGTQSAWSVLKSADGGSSWALADFYLPSGRTSGSTGRGIAVDAQGNVYATGGAGGYWVTRKSTDGGTTWTTIDTFQYFAKFGQSQGASVSFDYQGNVYVAGFGASSKQGYYWIVRELPVGSSSWQNSDVFQLFSGLTEPWSTQSSILSANGGHVLFVTGYAFDSSSTEHFVTRRLIVP